MLWFPRLSFLVNWISHRWLNMFLSWMSQGISLISCIKQVGPGELGRVGKLLCLGRWRVGEVENLRIWGSVLVFWDLKKSRLIFMIASIYRASHKYFYYSVQVLHLSVEIWLLWNLFWRWWAPAFHIFLSATTCIWDIVYFLDVCPPLLIRHKFSTWIWCRKRLGNMTFRSWTTPES